MNRKSIPFLSVPDVRVNTTFSTLSHVMRWQDILRDLTWLLKLVEVPGDPFRRNYCRGDERRWVYQLASHGTRSRRRLTAIKSVLGKEIRNDNGGKCFLFTFAAVEKTRRDGRAELWWWDERRLRALDTKVFYFSQFSLIFFPWQPRQEKHRKLLRFIIEFSSSSPHRLRFCQSLAKSAVISSIY